MGKNIYIDFINAESKKRTKKIILITGILMIILLCIFFRPLTSMRNLYLYKLAHPTEQKIYYKQVTKSTMATTSNNQELVFPANGSITSGYGNRIDPLTGSSSFHTGIDISCYTHRDSIFSIANGIVTFAGEQPGYGYCVEIRHDLKDQTLYSFYAHLSSISVSENDTVTQGQIIGQEGGDPYSDPNPGYSTGHHLHFEIRTASGYGNDIDPNSIF